jgi:hypothetical protein
MGGRGMAVVFCLPLRCRVYSVLTAITMDVILSDCLLWVDHRRLVALRRWGATLLMDYTHEAPLHHACGSTDKKEAVDIIYIRNRVLS